VANGCDVGILDVCRGLIIRVGDVLCLCILIGSLNILILYRVVYVEEQLCVQCDYIWLSGGYYIYPHDVDVFMAYGFQTVYINSVEVSK
jgi:hypothetical protein